MIGLGLICCFIRRSYRMRSWYTRKQRLCEATSMCTIPIYPYKEIERATNHFSDKQRLGTGAYGTVYAGKLHGEDQWVAIKKIKHSRDNQDTIQQVVNEIRLLSSVRHPNLVRLLGCSIDQTDDQVLVYEFMPNGTLSQHLLGERGQGLPWPVRLSIATETAQAITHLHSADPPIYHRDVKSSNILLDYDFKSKVADFGLSRLGRPDNVSHISTAPQGTPGYLDPQYHQNFHLSDKSDVYSFGVVLVEIITSLKVVDFNRRPNEVNLAALAVERIGQGRLNEIVDPSLDTNKDEWTRSSIQKVAELAFRCLAFHRDSRPLMAEVAEEMQQIRLSSWSNSNSEESCKEKRPVSEVVHSYCSSPPSSSCSTSMKDKLLSGSEEEEIQTRSIRCLNSNESMLLVKENSNPYSSPGSNEDSTTNSNNLGSSVNNEDKTDGGGMGVQKENFVMKTVFKTADNIGIFGRAAGKV